MSQLILKYATLNPPLVSLLAQKYVKTNQNLKIVPSKNLPESTPAELIFPSSGDVLHNDHVISRFVARSDAAAQLYGYDALSSSLVDEFLDVSNRVASADEKSVPALLSSLNVHLILRTYLVGHSLTLADFAIWGAIRQNGKAIQAVEGHDHLNRWFSFVDALPAFQAMVALIPESKQHTRVKTTGKYPPLPNAVKGKVVTRFPPEPSGFLHIGHAKAALLNEHYAREYDGKFIIRFDDTNPAKEKQEYVDAILRDLARMGLKPDLISYTSDYFERLQEMAEKMLKDGRAFVDTSDKLEINDQRRNCKPSPCRDQTIEKNLELWEEMKKASPIGKKCVMRAKIDPTSKNGALRDPNIYRCVEGNHYRIGTKYKVYPTYDFACPLVDSWEGVTHSLRSNEYHDRNALYDWIVEATKLQHKPIIMDFSRLNFSFTLLSKRKLQWFVDNKIVPGWDDPSFPTISGLLRRGLTVEALRKFVKSQGASKAAILMDMDNLWAVNKGLIDPVIPRYSAVAKDAKVPLRLTNGPKEVEGKTWPLYRKNPALGNKLVLYSQQIWLEAADAKLIEKDEEVTLMNWGNCIIRKIEKGASGDVTALEGELHLAGNVKDTKKKLTWIPNVQEVVELTAQSISTLITKRSLQEGDRFEDFVNKNIKSETTLLGDPNLKNLKQGDHLQLERRGYFIVDSPYVEGRSSLRLIEIPDGMHREMSVLASKKK